MATQAQIDANRRNSQRSTGPVTAAGKAASCLNAVKTGIYAESLLIQGESADTLDDLARQYQDTCRPVGPREQASVDTLVHSDWLLRRMRRVESLLWNEQAEQALKAKYKDYDPAEGSLTSWYCAEEHFLRIQRRLTALERAYHRALIDLERLQAKRLAAPDEPAAPEIGFVPSPAEIVVQPDPPDPVPSLPLPGFIPPLADSPQPTPSVPHALPAVLTALRLRDISGNRRGRL